MGAEMIDFDITQQEWELNFSQLQLGMQSQMSEASFLSYLEDEIDDEAQEAFLNGESYIPEAPLATVQVLQQTVPIYSSNVAETAKQALQAYPAAAAGLHAQKIIDAYASGLTSSARAELVAGQATLGQAIQKIVSGDYIGGVFGPTAEASLAMKMLTKAGLAAAIVTAGVQVATAENHWEEAGKQTLILAGTAIASGVVSAGACCCPRKIGQVRLSGLPG